MISMQRKAKEAAEGVPGDAKTLREKSQEPDTFSAPGGGGGTPPAALGTRSDIASPNRAKRTNTHAPPGNSASLERRSPDQLLSQNQPPQNSVHPVIAKVQRLFRRDLALENDFLHRIRFRFAYS